ncbi:BrnT family toxin [Haloechinothrix sp. YIM 98757]|uniref:BrnT family toxin n=1 Tax=Haloechinothrix aidingensis TaxID=2752311 RepID=A0A838AF41_9PSEU|nr:BrnT family toxin [Haloechinothrix aidingensis]MBA0127810.1 BrnT family toxin [Haloechinothrix aidingensis]
MWKGVKDGEWSAEHIARHGVTMDEVREAILYRPYWMTAGKNDSTLIYGRTRSGRYLFVVAVDDGGEAFIVTARDMTTREKRTFSRKAR